VATALIEGRTIIIEGGNYVLKNRVFECVDCGEVWEVEPCSVGGSKVYVLSMRIPRGGISYGSKRTP
jgi:uncharacterized protein